MNMANPRIISGKAKGLRLKTPPGSITRPIMDRVKEALFNIINGDIIASHFLDLFAGSGSVGIEALSRGAEYVRFIENNPRAYEITKENIKASKLGDNADLLHMDAFKYIESFETQIRFDYAYIAPPQYKELWSKMLLLLDVNIQHLNSYAWVICQIDPVEYQTIELINLFEFDIRQYGDTLMVFYSFKKSV